MPRVSLDITPEEHDILVTRAARAGQSVQDYVRARAFEADELPQGEARRQLAALLQERIDQANDLSDRTAEEIVAAARAKALRQA